jgi:prepilin-type N-terminal cleavage/methylation domain-containing protein
MPGRRAYTLIELLVVPAIIAVLIALRLPAVQKVREAASRSQCQNNLHQLGLAAHSYHDALGRFPPAVLMPYARAGNDPLTGGAANPFGPNWAVFLLPYLEQQALYARGNPASYPGTTDLANLASYNLSWRQVSGARVKTLLCPSDAGQDVPFTDPGGAPPEPGWARGNYACSSGTADTDHHVNGDLAVPNPPYPGLSEGAGHGHQLRLPDVSGWCAWTSRRRSGRPSSVPRDSVRRRGTTRTCKRGPTVQATRHRALAFLPTMTLTVALSGAVQGQEKPPAQASTPPRAPAAVTALMPQPRSIAYGDGWLDVRGASGSNGSAIATPCWAGRCCGFRTTSHDEPVSMSASPVPRAFGSTVGGKTKAI